MIKNIGMLIFAGTFFLSCSSGVEGEKAKTEEAKDVKAVEGAEHEYTVDASNSIVEWKGSKPSGEHYGTVNIKQGKILLKEGNLIAGKFTMDMKSIIVKDLTDAEWNKKLVDHLNSSDFFNTAEYTESTFELTSAKPYDGSTVEGADQPTHYITGNLTIKGIVKSITFPAFVQMDKTMFKATSTQFVIDRTEWDVRYQSKKFFDDLKDKFIYDEIGLRISIASELKR